jgi:hypothetical protein
VSATALRELLATELDAAAPGAAQALAAELARRGGKATMAVLYYGSALRAGDLTGVLDFYVLLDDVRAWPGSWFARLGNRMLPPNVGYVEFEHEGQSIRAKYAVMSHTQFAARTAMGSLDTTIWARFCQPALLVWSRSPGDRIAVIDLVAAATRCAAHWAAGLGPVTASAGEFWRALFARTYSAELRVEKSGRAQDIVGKNAARYAAVLPLAWTEDGLPFSRNADGTLAPGLSAVERARVARQWARCARWGRPLNIARLIKAAFTFEGATDYAVWKVERHSGVRVEVAPWQRRFPLLAAPGLYWKLRRRGVLK